MGRLEFYTINDDLWVVDERSRHTLVTESARELVSGLFERIAEYWPEAYGALAREYAKSAANVPYFQWLVVRRFFKCNFGKLDTTTHDFCDGRFNFEKVDCPLRGECRLEGVVCCPKFSTTLTPMQRRVMERIYRGEGVEEAAEALFISQNTVRNHIKASYTKLGVHDRAEFVRYATEHDLFSSHT